jgi:hypothetical protein
MNDHNRRRCGREERPAMSDDRPKVTAEHIAQALKRLYDYGAVNVSISSWREENEAGAALMQSMGTSGEAIAEVDRRMDAPFEIREAIKFGVMAGLIARDLAGDES